MTGQTPLAQWCNRLLEYAISIAPCSSPTVKTRATGKGTVIIAQPGNGGSPPSPTSTALFAFVSSQGDYIVATNIATGVLTQIAKPNMLRNSLASRTYDGQIWTYQYTSFLQRTVLVNGNIISYERVAPRYAVGDLLLADQPGTANIGVLSVGGDGTTIPAGTALIWMEQNRDGRAWAETANGQP